MQLGTTTDTFLIREGKKQQKINRRLLRGCEESSEIKGRQGGTKVSGILFGFEERSSSP